MKKLILPAAILLGCIILGGFIYGSQINKQRSIERQQRLDLEVKQEELQVKIKSDEVKAEQDKKEYIAKRKNECYDLYEKERNKWNNVKDFSYSEVRDICIVKYTSDKPAKTKEECRELVKDISGFSESLQDMFWDSYLNCLENWFSKEF